MSGLDITTLTMGTSRKLYLSHRVEHPEQVRTEYETEYPMWALTTMT